MDLSISLLPLALRRIKGVKVVSSGAVNRPIPQAEFGDTLRRYQRQAATVNASMPEVVTGLWRSEGLSTTFGKYRLPENTLNDPAVPRESLPIAHVGYGAASTEFSRFDIRLLHEIVATKSHPDFRGFATEGIGSILRIYEPGIFKFMCGALGLIPKGAPPGPDKSGFFADFFAGWSAEEQRLIVHGYGRLVAFSKISIYKAIEEAMALPPACVCSCVQGAAFAFAMMNSQEMPRLLARSDIGYPADIRAAFQDGMTYAMIFCEWFAPGFLAAWTPRHPLEATLIDRARQEDRLNQTRGFPLPFALEHPFRNSPA
jgi:hypothetical protein